MIGRRLGSYEVVAKLGEGGMGEVYRARDLKLNRDVAVKVLPAAFTLDPDRLARFRREAQLRPRGSCSICLARTTTSTRLSPIMTWRTAAFWPFAGNPPTRFTSFSTGLKNCGAP